MKKVLSSEGHILLLSPSVGMEISEEEHAEILKKLEEMPKNPPVGHSYRLRDSDLTWQLYAMPEDDEIDPELTAEEALEIIMGGAG